MKINTLNKTLLAAFMAVTLAACTNTSTPQSSAAANPDENAEVVVESSDIIDESIKEDSEDNKPADDEVAKKEDKKDSNDSKTTIDVEKKQEVETKKEEDTSNVNEATTSNPEKQEEASDKEDINYQEREGSYISNLIASKNGDRDPQAGLTSLANLKVDGETLTLEGTIDYLKNPDSYDNSEEYNKASYNFKLTSDTKFQAVGGMADPEIFTKEEFVDYYQGVKDSGLALKIEVKDGVVTTVSIAS